MKSIMMMMTDRTGVGKESDVRRRITM